MMYFFSPPLYLYLLTGQHGTKTDTKMMGFTITGLLLETCDDDGIRVFSCNGLLMINILCMYAYVSVSVYV